MPKATLTFQLPEERCEFYLASKGAAWYFVAWELDQWLRGQIKYAPDGTNADYLTGLKKCREQLRACMNDAGVSFEEVE